MSDTVSRPGEWPADLMRGLRIQTRVLGGMIIRLMMTKYGRNNIGFLWIIAEPMILCGGVLLLRSIVQGGSEKGVPLIGMLFTGYMPLTLWRHLTNSGVFLMRRSASLLYHRDISLLDCFISFLGIEIAGCTMASILVYWLLYTCGFIAPINDLGLMLFGWLSMAFISASVMLVFGVMTEYFEPAERFIQPFQYLSIPLCGFIFLVDWLPTPVQKWAVLVPSVNCFEMIRAGLYGATIQTHYMWWYPAATSLVIIAIVLPMIEPARDKIHFG